MEFGRRYRSTRGRGLSGMNLDEMTQIPDEKPRKFGTELSQNIVNQNHHITNNNHRKRTFKQLNDEQKEEEGAPRAKRVRYNLRSRSITMESCADLGGKENKIKSKNMKIDSDESCDEDIDLMSYKTGKPKRKRKKIAKHTMPLRRSVRLKNKRLKQLKREIASKAAREPKYILEKSSLLDCDEENIDNDLFVTGYVSDITAWYHECESSSFQRALIKNGYVSSSFQCDLNDSMRSILLNWLLNVHRRFKLSDATLFLGIYMMDAYLSLERIRRDELQLIGCASMWIASKYHEIYAPEANDFAYISAYSFDVDALFGAEIKILVALKFSFASIMTPLHFMERYLQLAHFPIRKKYRARGSSKALQDGEKYVDLLSHLSCYFIELSLFDCKLISRQKPSMIAAAALCFAILSISLYPQWPDFLRKETTYSYSQLKPVLKRLNQIRILSNTQLKSCRKKHPNISNWLDRLNIKAAINNKDE